MEENNSLYESDAPLFVNDEPNNSNIVNENVAKLKETIISNDLLIKGIKEKEVENSILKEENNKLTDIHIAGENVEQIIQEHNSLKDNYVLLS